MKMIDKAIIRSNYEKQLEKTNAKNFLTTFLSK